MCCYETDKNENLCVVDFICRAYISPLLNVHYDLNEVEEIELAK